MNANCRPLAWLLFLAIYLIGTASGEEAPGTSDLAGEAAAPPNSVSYESTLGGAYFVDERLLAEYESIRALLQVTKQRINGGELSSDEATRQLQHIQQQADDLRHQLEEAKVLVSPFQIFTQTAEQTFALGDEQLVVITADQVAVRGWEGPGLKCVIEKTIVAKERPAESEFDAIAVEHALEVASEIVGLTREERERQEEQFFASPDGQRLSNEQKAARRKFVDEIHASYDTYAAFQGRAVNQLELRGLTHQAGNRQLSLRMTSPGGGATHSSQWQRHAALTVYVPSCKALAIRGCQVGLDVADLQGDLLLTTDGSRDRNYAGTFTVRNVRGNVVIDQAPVRLVSEIAGDVRIVATDEFVNSGTLHENDTRTFSTYAAQTTRIERIAGDLQAELLRTGLTLADIEGTIDVVNHYGSTDVDLQELDVERAHRIISHSGDISVTIRPAVLEAASIHAYTRCGRLHTNIDRQQLEETSFSTGSPQTGWHGFVSPRDDRHVMAMFERPAAVLTNSQREPGFDLISHAGVVSILTADGRGE